MGSSPGYDALLLVSFGGPEAPGEVMPFLARVLGGRATVERMREVAAHYDLFGGVSPINSQNRALLAALRQELGKHGPKLPVYWGNRFWPPLVKDALEEMARDGVRRALAFVTSPFSSNAGCRGYLEAIAEARAELGERAPQVEKLRGFYNHPGFVAAAAERLRGALASLPEARRAAALVILTAHSLPLATAGACDYEVEFAETSALVMERVGSQRWSLAYQSAPASLPWLGPDIAEALRTAAARGARDVVVAPVGFFSDHMEVVYDLDVAARAVAGELGLGFVRAPTVGTHPAILAMVRELILERSAGGARRFLGARGARPDQCAPDCCPAGSGRPAVITKG
jgi:ferrochelatase